MRYENKNTQKLKERLAGRTDANAVMAASKMQKAKSSIKSAASNIGRIVNRTGEADKAANKIGDKANGVQAEQKKLQPMTVQQNNKQKPVAAPPVKQSNGLTALKNSAGVTLLKYNGKTFPVSKFQEMAMKDKNLRIVMDDVKRKRAEELTGEPFSEYLYNKYKAQ